MAVTEVRKESVTTLEPVIATGSTVRIPTYRYTSEEYAQAEFDKVWSRVWQMACRVDDVKRPGDFAEYAIGDQSVLVVRGADGNLRAFSNRCLHRGNQLKSGCGRASELRCRYHLWAWNLDGTLKDVPDRDGFPGLEDDDYELPEVRVDSWGGFVFVNFDGDAEPLLEFLGAELTESLAPYHFENMSRTSSATTPISANWKVVVEAFLEVYHVQAIHPQLLPMLDDVNTTYSNFETHSRMIVPFGVPSPRLGDHVDPLEILSALMNAAGGNPDQDPPQDPPQDGTGGGTVAQMTEAFKGMLGPDGQLPDGLSVRQVIINMSRMMGAGKGLDYSGLTDDQMIDDWHYHIFPNLVFNTHAGGFLFFRVRPEVGNPHRCFFDIDTYSWIADPEKAKAAKATNTSYDELSHSFGLVIDQDMRNLPGVQKGLRCRNAHDYVTVSAQETRIPKLHEVLDRYLARG